MVETVAEAVGVTMMMVENAMETVLAAEISGANGSARETESEAEITGNLRCVGETVTKEGLMPAATRVTPARRIRAGGQRSVRGKRALFTNNAETTARA